MLHVHWSLGGTLTVDQVRKVAGAAFNLQMLSREPAAFAHARTYARRAHHAAAEDLAHLDDQRAGGAGRPGAGHIYAGRGTGVGARFGELR